MATASKTFKTVLLLGLVFAGESFADPGSLAGPGSQAAKAPTAKVPLAPPADPNAIEELPIQSKFHERADENIAVQALYLGHQSHTLEELLAPNPKEAKKYAFPDQKERNAFAQDATGGFCKDLPVGHDTDDDVNRCLKHYHVMQMSSLENLKTSLKENQDEIVRLNSNAVGMDGKYLEGEQAGNPKAPPLIPVLDQGSQLPAGKHLGYRSPPSMIDFSTMKVDLAGNKDPEVPDENKQSEWYLNLSQGPKPVNYAQATPVRVEPGNPKSSAYAMVVRDKSGNPVLDPTAFAKANARWLKSAKTSALQKVHNEYVNKRLREIRSAQRLNQTAKAKVDPTKSDWHNSVKDMNKTHQDMIKTFCASRRIYVDKIQKRFSNGDGSGGLGKGKADPALMNENMSKICDTGDEPVLPTRGVAAVNVPKPVVAQNTGDSVYMTPDDVDDIIKANFSFSGNDHYFDP